MVWCASGLARPAEGEAENEEPPLCASGGRGACVLPSHPGSAESFRLSHPLVNFQLDQFVLSTLREVHGLHLLSINVMKEVCQRDGCAKPVERTESELPMDQARYWSLIQVMAVAPTICDYRSGARP
jgi:hypothetical protein